MESQVETVAFRDEAGFVRREGIPLRRAFDRRRFSEIMPLRLEHRWREQGLHESVGHNEEGVPVWRSGADWPLEEA